MDKVQKPSDSECVHHRQNPSDLTVRSRFYLLIVNSDIFISNYTQLFNAHVALLRRIERDSFLFPALWTISVSVAPKFPTLFPS